MKPHLTRNRTDVEMDTNPKSPIHAVIGVRRDGALTYYVRRSMHMSNYKGVWSLPSIKFDPDLIDGVPVRTEAQSLFDALSSERLGGVPVIVREHITSGTSDMNPMGVDVTLHLYEITMPKEPILEPRYYTQADWLDAGEYEERSRGQPCGLCTRLWGDHAWLMGYSDRPFIAHLADERSGVTP